MNLILPFVASATAAADAHSTPTAPTAAPKGRFLKFHKPDYFDAYAPPTDSILIGDSHITRGGMTVIGGVPGCGKSRLIVSLAIAGAQGPGATWMGLPVQAHFRTCILQVENGSLRLKNELAEIRQQGIDLQDWLHITEPPAFGLAFHEPDFLEELREWLAFIQPGVVAIDPWNRCVMDDKAKDYRAALEAVNAVLPPGQPPAIVVIHHLRKASSGDTRKRGRDLLPELSGSHVIGSACRAAFILEPATADGEDDRVIFTCAKNNDGQMGPSTAWRRRNGLFAPCPEFDWDTWGEEPRRGRKGVELEDLAAVFSDAEGHVLTRKEAADALMKLTGLGRTMVYAALRSDSPYADYLREVGDLLIFKPEGRP